MQHDARHGAKQPGRFDPARASILDDTARFAYLPPAEVIALLGVEPAATVLDFGAGTGTYTLEIAQAHPRARILALDEQPEMLALLRAKLAAGDLPNVEVLAPPDATRLHGEVDRILALNVLHELGDAALAELRSFLAPAGRALIIDWNADVEREHGPRKAHVYGVEEAQARLAQNGLRTIAVRRFANHYALTAVNVEASR